MFPSCFFFLLARICSWKTCSFPVFFGCYFELSSRWIKWNWAIKGHYHTHGMGWVNSRSNCEWWTPGRRKMLFNVDFISIHRNVRSMSVLIIITGALSTEEKWLCRLFRNILSMNISQQSFHDVSDIVFHLYEWLQFPKWYRNDTEMLVFGTIHGA